MKTKLLKKLRKEANSKYEVIEICCRTDYTESGLELVVTLVYFNFDYEPYFPVEIPIYGEYFVTRDYKMENRCITKPYFTVECARDVIKKMKKTYIEQKLIRLKDKRNDKRYACKKQQIIDQLNS